MGRSRLLPQLELTNDLHMRPRRQIRQVAGARQGTLKAWPHMLKHVALHAKAERLVIQHEGVQRRRGVQGHALAGARRQERALPGVTGQERRVP